MLLKLLVVWNLLAGSPGHHPTWDRPIAETARRAVRDSRQAGERPTVVACAILCGEPMAEGDTHEDTLTCRAAPDAATAVNRLFRAMGPDAELWPNPDDYPRRE